MARPVSDEELQLKKRARRRLVGAIVLVTAVAVILPMVLDSEPRPSGQNVDIQIPSPDAGEFKPKAPAGGQGADSPTAKSSPEPKSANPGGGASAEAPAAVSPIADAATPPASTKAKPAAADATKHAAPAGAKDAEDKTAAPARESAPRKPASAASGGAYVVQAAALADAGKAKQLEQKMAGTGLDTYTEVVKTKSGEVTRVRAGPYASREAAEQALTRLEKAGLSGQVMRK